MKYDVEWVVSISKYFFLSFKSKLGKLNCLLSSNRLFSFFFGLDYSFYFIIGEATYNDTSSKTVEDPF